jgi:DALR anticodon binding domain
MMRRLHQVLHIQAQNWRIESSDSLTTTAIDPDSPQIPPLRDIPIRLVTNQTEIFYVSAIALQLSKPWQKPASQIAQSLVETLVQTVEEKDLHLPDPSIKSVWKQVFCEANASGWLILRLTDQGVAEWLQSLLYLFNKFTYSPERVNLGRENLSIVLSNPTDGFCPIRESTELKYLSRNSTDLFQAQYIHARCCSLLNLGIETRILEPSWQFEPAVLPWLDAKGTLRCRHPGEWRLIEQICQSWDQISLINGQPAQTVKLIQELSQAFHDFYGNCLIFGEVRMNEKALAQVRLGLVAVVRSLLHTLLNQLDIVAPTEL